MFPKIYDIIITQIHSIVNLFYKIFDLKEILKPCQLHHGSALLRRGACFLNFHCTPKMLISALSTS